MCHDQARHHCPAPCLGQATSSTLFVSVAHCSSSCACVCMHVCLFSPSFLFGGVVAGCSSSLCTACRCSGNSGCELVSSHGLLSYGQQHLAMGAWWDGLVSPHAWALPLLPLQGLGLGCVCGADARMFLTLAALPQA
jgi:hypothetical protein